MQRRYRSENFIMANVPVMLRENVGNTMIWYSKIIEIKTKYPQKELIKIRTDTFGLGMEICSEVRKVELVDDDPRMSQKSRKNRNKTSLLVKMTILITNIIQLIKKYGERIRRGVGVLVVDRKQEVGSAVSLGIIGDDKVLADYGVIGLEKHFILL